MSLSLFLGRTCTLHCVQYSFFLSLYSICTHNATQCNVKSISYTILYILFYFIVNAIYFCKPNYKVVFSFSCCVDTQSSILTLTIFSFSLFCIYTYDIIYKFCFFCVSRILCRHDDKQRKKRRNINKNILKSHGSIVITIIAFGSWLVEFFVVHNSFFLRLLFSKAQSIRLKVIECYWMCKR